MRRTTLLCLAAALALAFAPAPLPRRAKNVSKDDLLGMQGSWYGVTHNGRRSGDFVVVRGDLWRANTPNDSWVIKLDPSRSPKHIDLVSANDKVTIFRGIYKLEGDTFTYSLGYNVPERDRPRDFDPNQRNAWVSVFTRKKP
jgi:uncharacterized protein (TIGR03067 family)